MAADKRGHKVQNTVPMLPELRDTQFWRALEVASVVMISDYCKKEGEGLSRQTKREPCR